MSDEPWRELQQYGLAKIYRVDNGLEHQTLDAYAASTVAAWQRYRPWLLLWAATSRGREVAARVAASLGTGFLANVVDYDRGRRRPMRVRCAAFNNQVHLAVSLEPERAWVLTLHLPSLEAVPIPTPQDAELISEHYALSPEQLPLCFGGLERVPLDTLDIREASVVIGVGRGVGNAATLSLVQELGQLLGAPVGGSRVAVEMGLVPPTRQIGLSGQSIAAEVYIACGISGATHHVMGLRGVKHILAINRDRHAPIFQVAQAGIVGDLREVVPALIDSLKTRGVCSSA